MNKEEVDRGLEAWKVTIGVQQHFNDLEMRIRNYALTLLLAVLAGAGIAIREHETVRLFHHDWSLGSVVLLGGLIVWLLFFFMDALWYHRLLLGAVAHGAALEAELSAHVPGIALTKRIGEASPFDIPIWRKKKLTVHSTHKIRIFYWIVALVLAALAVIVQVGMPAVESSNPSTTPSPTPSSALAPNDKPVRPTRAIAVSVTRD